jgi:hypothetical protein
MRDEADLEQLGGDIYFGYQDSYNNKNQAIINYEN